MVHKKPPKKPEEKKNNSFRLKRAADVVSSGLCVAVCLSRTAQAEPRWLRAEVRLVPSVSALLSVVTGRLSNPPVGCRVGPRENEPGRGGGKAGRSRRWWGHVVFCFSYCDSVTVSPKSLSGAQTELNLGFRPSAFVCFRVLASTFAFCNLANLRFFFFPSSPRRSKSFRWMIGQVGCKWFFC